MDELNLAREIERVYREEGAAVLVTVIEAEVAEIVGAKMLIEFPGIERHRITGETLYRWFEENHPSLLGQVVETARELLSKETAPLAARRFEDESASLQLMLELLRAEPQLVICGAGHIGQALAPMARLLDFDVTIIDDRADFASAELFPDQRVQLIAKPFAEAVASIKITPSTSIVIVTRGHKYDEDCLRILLNSPARYIGMIGSRRRVITVFRRLLEEGAAAESLKRIHAPIGLDIGARTPAEIAISIMAEVVLAKYQGTGAPKRHEIESTLDKILYA